MLVRAFAAGLLVAAPVQAAPGDPPRSTGEAMGDAVTQPLADVNLKRRGIPPLLTAIRANPYSLDGIRTCRDIIAAISALDSVLGDDVDRIEADPQARERRETAAGLTGGLIAGLIPFRALIREVSGARSAQDDYREAVYAGVIRRGFLKGYGQARRCRAGGRPLRPLESAGEAARQTLGRGDAN
jgi:hypothetical protein